MLADEVVDDASSLLFGYGNECTICTRSAFEATLVFLLKHVAVVSSPSFRRCLPMISIAFLV